MNVNSIITSTGSYIPEEVIPNEAFHSHRFMDKSGIPIPKPTKAIVQKMEEITTIKERRYAGKVSTSKMAANAGSNALDKVGFDREALGGIIVAHNFGDILCGQTQGQLIPNLAARVKHELGIRNSKCFAFDVLFGCPGWVLAMDQAHQYLQNGITESILVIGVETLSRVVDPNDVDGMLFGDGAGAALLTAEKSESKRGILGYQSHTDCLDEVEFLTMSKPIAGDGDNFFIRMNGRNVFKYAVSKVPLVVNECLKKTNTNFEDVKHFLFHQANGKMLEVIAQKLAELNNSESILDKTPMNIQYFGNSSVATVPTLLSSVLNGEFPAHKIEEGDIAVMSSVGAGMHSNCLVYQF